MHYLIHWGKTLGSRIGADDIGSYTAALAYNFLFALFPLALFVIALLSTFHIPDAERLLLTPIRVILSPTIGEAISQALKASWSAEHPTVMSLAFFGFIWGMSGFFLQIADALNHAYRFIPQKRPMWLTYATAVGLGIVVGMLLVGDLALGISGVAVTQDLLGYTHTAGGQQWLVAHVVHWTIYIGGAWMVFTLLYMFAPDRRQPFGAVQPGALFALGASVLVALGYSFATRWLGQTNRMYGTLGAIIGLLIYFNLLGWVLLFGAEINAIRFHGHHQQARTPKG